MVRKMRANKLLQEKESDPVRILAAVLRGFDIANPETVGQSFVARAPTADNSIKTAEGNWKNLRHPTKKGVKPVGIYPVLPDPEALGELNGYCAYKFATEPLGTVGEAQDRDERVDVSLLRIRYLSDELAHANGTQSQAVQKDRTMTLDFYAPTDTTKEGTRTIKRKFADLDGTHDTPEEDENGFKYQFVRAYEQQVTHENPREVALILHDPEVKQASAGGDDDDDLFGDEDQPTPATGLYARKKQKGAYWYPIFFKGVLRAKRDEKIAQALYRPTVGARVKQEKDVEEEGRIDLLNVIVRDSTEEENVRIGEMAKRYYGVERKGERG